MIIIKTLRKECQNFEIVIGTEFYNCLPNYISPIQWSSIDFTGLRPLIIIIFADRSLFQFVHIMMNRSKDNKDGLSLGNVNIWNYFFASEKWLKEVFCTQFGMCLCRKKRFCSISRIILTDFPPYLMLIYFTYVLIRQLHLDFN